MDKTTTSDDHKGKTRDRPAVSVIVNHCILTFIFNFMSKEHCIVHNKAFYCHHAM